MGLGSTARRLQGLTDTAEELYHKITEVLERVRDIETAIDRTSEQVDEMEYRLEQQHALVRAIAEEHDLDIDAILDEVEPPDGPDAEEAVEDEEYAEAKD